MILIQYRRTTLLAASLRPLPPSRGSTRLSMSSLALRALDVLSAQLPFHLNDIEQVNRAFQRWQATGFSEPNRDIDLWTYCFVRRYFLVKFMHATTFAVSDLDAVVEEAFRKVDLHRLRLQDPSRYAHWVSVVCKNVFLNYVRTRRQLFSIDTLVDGATLAEWPVQSDLGFLTQALLDAIDRLPPFLREVAYLRFIKECSYEEIAARTGRPAASVRTFISKALARFRKDPRLRAFLEQLNG